MRGTADDDACSEIVVRILGLIGALTMITVYGLRESGREIKVSIGYFGVRGTVQMLQVDQRHHSR